MKGLDTNVLVRYLVRDDKKQAEVASAFMRKLSESGERCFINLVVVCELVWVLESAYDFARAEIAEALDKILTTKQFEIESKDVIRHAVNDYRLGVGDIADYLIGRINQAFGCERTTTFDRALKSAPAFVILE
jgi:predicted nucleic-acid-binding protein